MSEKTYDEALAEALEYFKGDDLAAKVFVDKYALKDDDNNFLEGSPDEMHKRLAKEFARIEKKYPNAMGEDEIFELMKDFKYLIPQGSPMSAVGNPYKLQSASNCFVIESPTDSYGGILKTDQELVQIAKRRGGIGFDISNIRPRGLPTSNAAGTTDGIGIFMERFSNSCREVAQSGRRGALLLSIDCHHPEIETFINIKKDLQKVTGANISVRWSDEFLQAVEGKKKVELRWPVDSKQPETTAKVDAKAIWEQFVDAAWTSAEPGCLFWDRAIEWTPSDIYAEEGFTSRSTNPCGEIILSPGDSCRLLLLNTLSFVKNAFLSNAEFDFKLFAEYVQKAQRLMDDLVDLEIEAVDKIITKVKRDPESDDVKKIELDLWQGIRIAAEKGRRTGLGVNAIGDTLAALGLTYGSKKSIAVVEQIYKAMALNAYKSSCHLAKERGAFDVYSFKKEKGHPFIEQLFEADPELKSLHSKHGRRNIAITTTAPSGSVSVLSQTTSGIEPVFMTHYTRRKKINPSDTDATVDYVDAMGDKWQEFPVYHHGLQRWMDATGKTEVEDSPYHKATANEIDWEAAVDLQAAAQKWVCHAISKTINLPADVSRDVIDKVYRRGWKKGLKGLTVYRDGCRSGVLINKDAGLLDEDGRPSGIVSMQAPKRPDELTCEIHHATVLGTPWTVLLGMMDENPYEIFMGYADTLSLPKKCKVGKIVKVKKGQYNLHVDLAGEDLVIHNIIKTFNNPEGAWATRMVSMALRHGTPIDFVVEQLAKDGSIMDVNKVLSRILKKFIKSGARVMTSHSCPSCDNSELFYMDGCMTCSCGWSRCG
jgi:ribonucleoside-diphosphate reductase alpha chain